MLSLDGSLGEGGGQILRTALALSLVTGTSFRMVHIRAGRQKPGLLRQHLTAVQTAARVGSAEVEGAALGSGEVTFRPGPAAAGRYDLAVGSAGSVALVLQAVLPPLLVAPGPSVLTLEGGTHNAFAPSFEFLAGAFLPLIDRLGPTVSAALERHGFYPAGGGRVRVEVLPCARLGRLDLPERGEVVEIRAHAVVSRLPRHIAERELRVIGRRVGVVAGRLTVREVSDAPGPGNAVTVEVESEHVTEVFTGFGERGVPAEAVADKVAGEVLRYLQAGVPVGEHLADQLLVPLALGQGGSFRTLEPTRHTRTNADVIRRFLDVDVALKEEGEGAWSVTVAR
jgi:RNA 3'-terminal phosphate cyclase (ATP)